MNASALLVYDDLDNAEQARAALIAGGFPPDRVHLAAREDEAGPAQGNFTVGNGFPVSGDAYERNFAPAIRRAICTLRVDVQDQDQCDRALDTMRAFGGIDPEARAARR